jgi:hypothetical protein
MVGSELRRVGISSGSPAAALYETPFLRPAYTG